MEAQALQDAAESGRRRTARANSQAAVIGKPPRPKLQAEMLQPILLFMTAKLVAYTILGFLLGLLGSTFQLTPRLRAFLLCDRRLPGGQRAAHAQRPPDLSLSSLRAAFVHHPLYSQVGKKRYTWVTPVLLGLLTVLIPCGVTQSMMAVAVGTRQPDAGRSDHVGFCTRHQPGFFLVAYLTTQIGARLEKLFMSFVAVVCPGLGGGDLHQRVAPGRRCR